jgi:ATP-dependent DNA helicase RecG
VGTTRAEKLAKLGLVTVRDALMHFPREYRDFSGAHAVADLREGEHASLAGEVTDVGSRTLFNGRTMLSVSLACTGGRVRCTWFNMPFMAKRFAAGMKVVIAGQPRLSGSAWEFAHPDVRWLAGGEEAHASDWLAIYPLAEGVQQSHVRLAVQAAIEQAAGICPEALPEEMLAAKALLPIERAFREIHRPSTHDMIAESRRRFVYQELLMLQIALRMHRARQQRSQAAGGEPPAAPGAPGCCRSGGTYRAAPARAAAGTGMLAVASACSCARLTTSSLHSSLRRTPARVASCWSSSIESARWG